MKKVEKFSVVVEREDGWYIAECPALPGCVSQGRTLKDAFKNIRQAIELSLETRAAHKIAPRPKVLKSRSGSRSNESDAGLFRR